MKKLVVLTGAGMSAESGIRTFRDSGGLWEGHDIEVVASPEGWKKNPTKVLDFYNARRRQLIECQPNAGHNILADIEATVDVQIITQNVDDLHERAGSSKVLHLHGELLKARSTLDPNLIYSWHQDIKQGDTCALGSQLRPHIVWFGEEVPAMEEAVEMVSNADFFAVIGTSLMVYPAAGLVHFVRKKTPKFVVDPSTPPLASDYTVIRKKATEGTSIVIEKILNEYL